ncbi:hypothetical protein [Methylomonas rivi]
MKPRLVKAENGVFSDKSVDQIYEEVLQGVR